MSSLNSHTQDLVKFWKGKILWDCPLADFTTLKVGGAAEAILFADNLEELSHLVCWLQKNNISWKMIGRGSNILVPDEGLEGVIVILSKGLSSIEQIEADNNHTLIRAGAGGHLAKLVNYCTKQGFSGLEFAVGIPGSVGGAIVMNAGCWGKEIADILHSVTILDADGNIHTKQRKNLTFSYRKWCGNKGEVVVSGTFKLTTRNPQHIKNLCLEYKKRRQSRQPQSKASAGSFFKNPAGQAAAKLIEEAGLKGRRVGGAMVSTKHANFIINTGCATARDIIDLMHEIQSTVYQLSGIMLEPEVHILGNEKGLQ